MLRSLAAPVAFGLVVIVQAQTVFIPDVQLRAKLNAWAPGLVDGSGNMPVNNFGMHPANLDLHVDWTPADLTGLGALIALNGLVLEVDPDVVLTMPAFPIDLQGLECTGFPAATPWPPAPPELGILHLYASDHAGIPEPATALFDLRIHDMPDLQALPDVGTTLAYLWLFRTGLVSVDLSSNSSFTGVQLEENDALTNFAIGGGFEGSNFQATYHAALTNLSIGGGCNNILIDDAPLLTSLGTLDEGVVQLTINGAYALATLPELPQSLQVLDVIRTAVAVLPDLPEGLQQLGLAIGPLTEVPPLPASLTNLGVGWYGTISTLPALPSGLQYLQFGELPNVTEIPALPDGLENVNFFKMPVTSIDYLPESIVSLTIDSLQITALPSVPVNTMGLTLRDCPVTELPSLPAGLQALEVTDCPLQCLPFLPFDLGWLDIAGTDVTCQPNHPPNAQQVFPLCTILTSSCPESAPYVSGVIFWDRNGNGTREANEPGLPSATIFEAPYGYMAGTDSTGRYEFAMALGQHTLTVDPGVPYVLGIEPNEHAVETTGLAGLYPDLDFAVVVDTIVPDLRVLDWWLSLPRPGFDCEHIVLYENLGTTAHDVQVRLAVDPLMQYVSSTVPPAVDGDELVWDLDSLGMGQYGWFIVTFHTPVGTPLGTPVPMSSIILPFAEDVDTLNNVYAAPGSVVGSFDPNDKQVTPAVLSEEEGLAGRRVEYFIRFQNTGNLAADRVLITDTLSDDFDPTTFEFLGASHTCEWFYREGALHFLFDPIFLPDSTSDEPGSHGSVLFSIETRPGLAPGYVVPNEANIYFDFNEPIITEPCLLEVELPQALAEIGAQRLAVVPVPTTGLVQVRSDGGWEGAAYSVLDAHGTQVLAGRLVNAATALDLTALSDGLYFLRIRGEHRQWTGRVIKQR